MCKLYLFKYVKRFGGKEILKIGKKNY